MLTILAKKIVRLKWNFKIKRIRGRLFSFVIILCTSHFVFSKVSYKQYLSDNNVQSKSNKALILWEYYIANSIDSLRILGTDLYQISSIEKSYYGKAIAQRILGCYDVRTGKIERGIRLLNASKNYFVAQNDFEMICESMNEIGIAYFLEGDLETATSFFKESMKYGLESPIATNRLLAEVNLAKVYFEKGKVPEAKFLLKHYIKASLALKKYESVSNAYSLLGEIALTKNQIKTAQINLDKQYYYANKSKNATYITRSINNQAINAFYQGKNEVALSLFKEVLKRRKREDFPFNTYDAYFNLARFYYSDQLDLSLKYMDSCFQIAKGNNMVKKELEVYEWRFQHFQDKRNKQLIDSAKQVIQSMEETNEATRKELFSLKSKNGKSMNSNFHWTLYILTGFSLILCLRLLLFRKKLANTNAD